MLIKLEDGRPLYRQVYEHLRENIISGDLESGVKLPSSRALAIDLCVSRSTVLEAYERLISEGYLKTTPGSGTFVNSFIKQEIHSGEQKEAIDSYFKVSSSAKMIRLDSVKRPLYRSLCDPPTVDYDFRVGGVIMDSFAERSWRQLAKKCLGEEEIYVDSQQGSLDLRQAIASHLRNMRNCSFFAENIVITQGAQSAFSILARLLLDPGDSVAVENPGYFGAERAFAANEANVVRIDVDSDGLNVDQLKHQTSNIKLIYITPSHQFPTGSTMSLERRLELVKWAKSTNACIIEDDYDTEFQYTGRLLEPIKSIDAWQRTIYVGTFSKVLSPSLRLGFVVLPRSLISDFVAMQSATGMRPVDLQQRILGKWMNQGLHYKHVRRMTKVYAKRRSVLLNSLNQNFSSSDFFIGGGTSGLHIPLYLNRIPTESAQPLVELLQTRGVALNYMANSQYFRSKILLFGIGFGLIEADKITDGIKILAEAIAEFY